MLNAVIQSQLLVHGKSAELNCQYWPAAQGMLAVPSQRRCFTDDQRRSKPWWLPMESIAGESTFLRAVQRRFGEDDAFMKSRLIFLLLVPLWLWPVLVIAGFRARETFV